MKGFLKKLFPDKPAQNLASLLKRGAVILDVRTPSEYVSGHLKNSINIPVDLIQFNLLKISKDKPVIACCSSGVRSGLACSVLRACGYAEVYDGGSWEKLRDLQQ